MAATPVKAATYVYVGNAESNDISVFKLDGKGELSAVQTVKIPVEKAGPSTPMAISPDKKLLYVGIRSQPFVAATFSIDKKTGQLTHVGNGPLADSMAAIATDRSGKFLLSASYGGNKISVNPVGANGVVEAPVQTLDVPPNAHMIAADPSNKYVLATSLGGDVINQFKFDAKSGKLTANEPAGAKVTAKAGPRHFVFDPKGKRVYLLNELDGSINVFNYDNKKGVLAAQEKSTASVLPPGFNAKIWAADIHITPNGQFLYATERTGSTLAGFKVGGDGSLTRIGDWPTEKQPRGFQLDPAGKYLFSVGQVSHSMTSYSIDQKTGKLTQLKQYPVGKNPNWVEVLDLR